MCECVCILCHMSVGQYVTLETRRYESRLPDRGHDTELSFDNIFMYINEKKKHVVYA